MPTKLYLQKLELVINVVSVALHSLGSHDKPSDIGSEGGMGVVEQHDAHHHADEKDAVVLLKLCNLRVMVADLGQGDYNEVEPTGCVLVHFFLQKDLGFQGFAVKNISIVYFDHLKVCADYKLPDLSKIPDRVVAINSFDEAEYQDDLDKMLSHFINEFDNSLNF